MREFLHSPEWMAALVLLIQAVVLVVQARILSRHAKTMEEHTRIAGEQEKTAKLIGQALDQQGKILDKQTKIMDDQFNFMKMVETKAEKVQVFECIMQVQVSFKLLLSALLEIPVQSYTDPMRKGIKLNRARLTEDLIRCSKALHTSAHMDAADRNYFSGWIRDMLALEESSDIKSDILAAKAAADKYKEFEIRMYAAASSKPQ
jgi:hypothetical protein